MCVDVLFNLCVDGGDAWVVSVDVSDGVTVFDELKDVCGERVVADLSIAFRYVEFVCFDDGLCDGVGSLVDVGGGGGVGDDGLYVFCEFLPVRLFVIGEDVLGARLTCVVFGDDGGDDREVVRGEFCGGGPGGVGDEVVGDDGDVGRRGRLIGCERETGFVVGVGSHVVGCGDYVCYVVSSVVVSV